MESCNTSKVLNNRAKLNRLALCEVSNTQKSKEAEVIKRWLQYGTRDSSSSKEDVNSVIEESEKDSTTQETVIFNGTREINIPTPRKVVSPTKVPWYQLPRVVIPIVTPPEVTVSKPNLEIMKSNQSSLTTIKKNSKKSKKSQPNNNNSILNWFGPSTSSNGQQSESDKPFDSQNYSSSPNSALDGNRNSEEICNSQQNESRPIASIGKKRSQGLDIKIAPLPDLENVDLGEIDMNLITDIVRLYDFIIKFEKPLELDLEYNGDKLKYADLEEMILDNRFHTRLAFLQSGLLYFLCKESEVELDIDLVNLQYYLVERYPNKEFLREKEYSEFNPRERMSIFIDFINEALHTNKLREFIKELTIPANHKRENFIRTERKKEIKFKINEIRVMIVNKENEIKNIETQLTKGFESETSNLDLPNAVTKRQKIVAKRKMEQEFNERRKDAADEIEILLQRIDKLEMEHKELDMLNKTERDHANCTLRGGSILNPSGRDERFYLIVKLGQDRDGKYYWFFRELGGVFVETIKWNYPEQDVDNSSLPLTSSSEWQFIGGIGIFRMLMTVLNTRDNKEKLLKTNLQMLEKEIEPTFDRLNLWIDKKRDVKVEKMEVDSEEVKSIMSQRQKSFWKLFDTVIRKKNVWSLEEYHIIMEEYVKRKIAELEKILRLVDPNLVFKDFQSSGINASDFVNEVKNMISETGFKFPSTVHASKSKKNKNWGWLYDVASKWYSLDIKTFSTLASWLDVMIEAGEPIVRSIKKRMQEQLTEKYKRPTRLRDRKNKVVVYKEESEDDDVDEVGKIEKIEKDDDVEEHKQPSKWSLRERKRVAYNN